MAVSATGLNKLCAIVSLSTGNYFDFIFVSVSPVEISAFTPPTTSFSLSIFIQISQDGYFCGVSIFWGAGGPEILTHIQGCWSCLPFIILVPADIIGSILWISWPGPHTFPLGQEVLALCYHQGSLFPSTPLWHVSFFHWSVSFPWLWTGLFKLSHAEGIVSILNNSCGSDSGSGDNIFSGLQSSQDWPVLLPVGRVFCSDHWLQNNNKEA